VNGAEALDAFLGGLAARDASLHTRRAYATAVNQYLDWLAADGVDWRSPPRTVLRGYLAALAARPLSRRSISSRLAALRSFYRHARREGAVDADPWSAVMTPRLPRRLPKVLSIEQVESLIDEAGTETSGARRPATSPRPLVLRDLALIETAYAAGLRIS
jgi:integrase/recombinase XerD